MAELETVRIKHSDVPGGMLINKADFDPKSHTLHASEKGSKGDVDAGAGRAGRKAAKADAVAKKAAKAPLVKEITKGPEKK